MWSLDDLKWLNSYVYNVDEEHYIDKRLRIPKEKNALKMDNGTNVHVIDILDDDIYGAQVMAVAPYINNDSNNDPDFNNIAIVAAGTVPFNDGFKDANAAISSMFDGKVSKQYPLVRDFIKKIIDNPKYTVTQLTGYSQGSYVLKSGAEFLIPTTVFNGWFRYNTLTPTEAANMERHKEMFVNYRKLNDETVWWYDGNKPEKFGDDFGTIVWVEGVSHDRQDWKTNKKGLDIEYYLSKNLFVSGMTENQVRKIARYRASVAQKNPIADVEAMAKQSVEYHMALYKSIYGPFAYPKEKRGKVVHGDETNNRIDGTDYNDTLNGHRGKDNLYAKGGNDHLFGGRDDDRLHGGDGDDEYHYRYGGGNDFISDFQGNNKIIFYDNIKLDDVEGTFVNGQAAIRIKKDKSTIVIEGFANMESARKFLIQFSDDKTISAQDDPKTPFRHLVGTESKDNIRAFLKNTKLSGLGGDDELTGSEGNDTLDGGKGNDRLAGGKGDDTYIFGLYYGKDEIDDKEGNHTIHFRPDIKLSSLYSSQGQFGDTSLRIEGRTDELVVKNFRDHVNWWYGNFNRTENRRQMSLVFGQGIKIAADADNSPFRLTKGTEKDDNLSSTFDTGTHRLYGNGGNDSLISFDTGDYLNGGDGNDYLEGRKGNDTLDGGKGNDQFYGGEGDDTYVFGYGSGQDRMDDYQGRHTIQFTPRVKRHQVYARTFKGGNVQLRLEGSEDSLEIQTFMDYHSELWGSWNSRPGSRHMDLLFADGQKMAYDAPDSPFRIVKGTNQNDLYLESVLTVGQNKVYGYGGNDKITGKAGNDFLDGGLGDDTMYANGGDDQLTGGDGHDYMSGGDGNDFLNGGRGNDQLYGGAGQDRYLFQRGDGQDKLEDKYGQTVLQFGSNILPQHLKLNKEQNHLTINYHQTDKVTITDYFFNNIHQNYSLSFATNQTATIDSKTLTLHLTTPSLKRVINAPASEVSTTTLATTPPMTEGLMASPVINEIDSYHTPAETVLTPEVTAKQLAPAEAMKSNSPAPTEGQGVVEQVPFEVSLTETIDKVTSANSETGHLVDEIKSSVDVLAEYPVVNTSETMAYIVQPLPDVTNQVVGQ